MPRMQQNQPKERHQQPLSNEIQDQDTKGERFLVMSTIATIGISSEELEDLIEV